MKKNLTLFLKHFFLIVFGLAMIYPVLWMVSGAFKSDGEILSGSLSLWPKSFSLENFSRGWQGFGGVSFVTYFKNSFWITSIATTGTVLSSACVAYAFSRINFKGRKFLFSLMIISMMLPGQIITISQYLIYNKIGWVGTALPLIVPFFFGSGFFIYQMMQFMVSIPKDLDESAYIDGASKYGVFFKIIFPLLRPSLITTLIIQFYWKWDDFMGPLIYLNKPSSYTVSVALRLFADASSKTDYGAMFAMSTLSLIPVFLLFLFFNRYLVEGISSSGMKG